MSDDLPSRERGYLLTWLLLPVQALLLAAAIAGWWSQRSETLFSNGRWIVGKDTGKYVFYAHAFLFQPLAGGLVDLTSCMGFQEILYARAEGPDRRLLSLRCDASIDPRAYLWVEVRKNGKGLLGCRFSNRKDYPSGFYRYDETGEIIAKEPCRLDLPAQSGGRYRIEVRLRDGMWEAMVQGVTIASIADTGSDGGRFGFRGSAWDRRPVKVGNIEMEFEDPAKAGRTWIERETFSRAPMFRRTLPIALLLGALAVALRRWRHGLLSGWIDIAHRPGFVRFDDIAFCLVMLVVLVMQERVCWPSGILIPLGIMIAEGLTIAGFMLLKKRSIEEGLRRPTLPVAAMGVALVLVAAATFLVHGRRLYGGGSDAAFILQPDVRHASPAFHTNAVFVSPGQPVFLENMAYAGQVVTADIVLTSNATLDVVFQQQSQRTRGDPEGEELPVRRRLLRLSTRGDVTTGLSRSTDNRPRPLTPVPGIADAGRTNRLVLRSDGHGVAVTLNGATTLAPALIPSGYGETGFMSYDGDAALSNVSVVPIPDVGVAASFLPVAGTLAPVILACFVWIIFRRGRRVSFVDAANIAFAALYPVGFCLLASLFLDAPTLAELGRSQKAWCYLALASTTLSLAASLVVFRPVRVLSVVCCNVVAVVAIAASAACVWELLPAAHPFRLKFAHDAIDPGELAASREDAPGPWYNSNWKIGTHIYPWTQRIGGRRLPRAKQDGVVRIFVLGGSQAWGAGAADSEHTFARLFENALRDRGLQVEVFNASANGGGILRSYLLYRDVLRMLQPDIVIADVGLNETSGLVRVRGDERRKGIDNVAKDLEAWQALCRRDNVEFLLVLEPMCGETPLQPIPAFYDALETVARRNGASVARPADKVYEMEQQHFVWWDTAHFTPYGHELFTRILLPDVEQLVRRHLAESITAPQQPVTSRDQAPR